MSQPADHPLHISSLMHPALATIVHALADRGGSDEQYAARTIDTWLLIQSFQPRDTIDLMLAGQVIGTNEMFADGIGDMLRGGTEPVKQRTRSSLVAMARLTLAQINELDRRGVQPYRTEAAVEQRTAPEVKAEPAKKPQHAQRRQATRRPESTATAPPTSTVAASPDEETSWVDETYQELVLQTPAMLAADGDPVPAQDTPAQDASAQETPAQETPAGEAPAETPPPQPPDHEADAHWADNVSASAMLQYLRPDNPSAQITAVAAA